MVTPCPQAVPHRDRIVLSRQQGADESILLMEPSGQPDYIDSETGS